MRFRFVARLVSGLLLLAVLASAQSTIFVLRHADRFGTEPDPELTEEGHRQARALAALLADAPVKRIFTSDMLRTHQTVAPLAEQFHLKPLAIPSEKLLELTQQIKSQLRPGEATVVVGHRATVPKIVHELTGKDVAPLAVSEYDRLEVITLWADGRSSVVTLRFGH